TLTIELYESTIRYSGEFYDAEVGLYYLRARYYDPYVGRFISEDTYKGRANEPLSLNRYTYVLNNPLIYWDPTGHWEQGDSKLNVEAQAKIIALTSAYYEAQTTAERQAIQKQANDIRGNSASKNSVTTPLVFQTAEIEKVVNQAIAQGRYMTFNEWTSTINKVGIYSTRDSAYASMQGTSTVTTTVIGRTNITVSSRYYYTTDTKTHAVNNISTASLNLSYQLRSNEADFVAEAIDYPNITLEQAIVILDTMERNGGKITESQLKGIGLKIYKNSVGGLEFSYNHTVVHGVTFAEAQAMYQSDKANDDLSSGAGVGSTKIKGKVTGRFGSRAVLKANGTYEIVSSRATTPTKIKPCNCFTAGTKIITDEGEKNIEEIEVGDMVLSKDDETGNIAYKEVLNLFRNERDVIYKLTIGGKLIETTFNHPFWVEGKGWVLAEDLKEGYKLLDSDGKLFTIDLIEIIKLKENVTVYNFEVADFHTYFVTDLSIWVHNTNTDSCSSGGTGRNLLNSKNPKDFLDEALERQGLQSIPKDIKEPWTADGYVYTVRIHAGNKKYTNADTIYRVSRQSVPNPDPKVQGSGLEYLGTDGKWYKESDMKETFKNGAKNPNFNETAARNTHIGLP
ncbi:polymorphic toxin-type HINT domain-containing protein, partial [Paenibacillus algorifonticola]